MDPPVSHGPAGVLAAHERERESECMRLSSRAPPFGLLPPHAHVSGVQIYGMLYAPTLHSLLAFVALFAFGSSAEAAECLPLCVL